MSSSLVLVHVHRLTDRQTDQRREMSIFKTKIDSGCKLLVIHLLFVDLDLAERFPRVVRKKHDRVINN